MNISILGLGYVGIVSAACLASTGHSITGVDISEIKVEMLNKGLSPIIEKDLPGMLMSAVKKGLIRATGDTAEAIKASELTFISVGTPSRPNGSLNTRYLENVCEQIGVCLGEKNDRHVLVFRSTMLPGTMRNIVIPRIEQHSGKKQDRDFFVVFNPEFLRESTAVQDFFNPSKTVIGADSDDTCSRVMALYKDIPGPKIMTGIEAAEMVKYVDNNFHALKITFANEVGRLCKNLGLDSHEVMDIFMKDTKLNISTTYLKPGFAFGGSCLPKDLRAISYLAKMLDTETPLLDSIMRSNNIQIATAVAKIISYGRQKIGIAGFTFKAGTDDLRESPVVEVIETLLGKGYDIRLYDRNISFARLMGANREYINSHIPHISSLMVESLDEILKDREVIVIGNRDEEFKRLLVESGDDQIILDLVRLEDCKYGRKNYDGICW